MAENRNPFISDRPIDTVHYARCAVLYIRETTDGLHTDTLSEEAALGLHLILEGVADALEEVSGHMERGVRHG